VLHSLARTRIVRVVCTLILVGSVGGSGCHRGSNALAALAPGASAEDNGVRLATAPDRFFTTGDVRLRYREIGRGAPVVLLHGTGASLDIWRGVADSLAAGYRVIVPDQRGHGQSSKFDDPARFGREMGADVVRLLDHLRVPRAHLVGHSMGGVIAAYVAVRHPDRVATASLVAPPSYADSASAAGVMAPVVAGLEQGGGMRAFFRHFAPGMPDSVAGALSAQALAANDLGSIIAVFRAFGGFQIGRAGAARARVPALVAVGTRDAVLVTNARKLAEWWPQSRFVEIAGADHLSVLRRPELLAAVRAQLQVRSAAGAAAPRQPGVPTARTLAR
jgi:pimeloyl-ACP methyl ester carboxylesterase